MKTWSVKVETKTGAVKVLKFKAADAAQAIDLACGEVAVANLLEVWQGKTRVV